MKKKIAITGGIGTGKSYVCDFLAKRGIQVYDCDKAAKRLMRDSLEIQSQLINLVGEEVYQGKILQKRVLSEFLLKSDANKRAVNAIVHPAVAKDFEKSDLNWLESAILFDSGFDQLVHFNFVVCVTAPFEVRVQRIMQRDGIDRKQARQWICRQLPQREIVHSSDFQIRNDGKQDIEKQLNQLFKKLENI